MLPETKESLEDSGFLLPGEARNEQYSNFSLCLTFYALPLLQGISRPVDSKARGQGRA